MACDAAHLHVRLRFRSSLRVAHIRTTYSMSEKTSASSYKNAHERTNTFMSIAISLLRKELQLKTYQTSCDTRVTRALTA